MCFNQQTESPLIIPYYAIPDTTVSTETGDKLVSTQDRGFPGFPPIGMKGIRGWLLSQVYQIPTVRNIHYALMSMIISSHKITNTSCWGGVVTVSNNTHHIKPGFRMLAFKLWRGRVHPKNFLKVFFSLQNPILRKFKLTHNFKTVQKRCLENFQINMKIN